MNVAAQVHPWSEDALYAKAVLYIERMESFTAEDIEFGFWSALTLELLARAALAHVSPALLANGENWRNIVYANGGEPTAKKFSPTSIGTKEVIVRLGELVPSFTLEIMGFCNKHIERRNSELHTGELAFMNLGTSEWLPKFYWACDVLLKSMGRSLSTFVTNAAECQALIDSLQDAAAKAVEQDIKAHAQVWNNKGEKSQQKAGTQAATWATRHAGHRVECPACKSPALLQGTPAGSVATKVSEDDVVQKQTMQPSAFECVACGLRISGFSKLSACGLGDAFTAKSVYSPAEFFGLHTEDELNEARNEVPEYEEDFNEG